MAKKYMVVGGRGNGGGSGSTTNYADLENKPSINNVTLTGNKTTSDLGIVIPTATSDLNNDSGFITSSDIPAQVQSDWNESDATSPAYIDNKPTIPTATSDLNNDSGFITSSDVPAQVQSDWNEADTTDPAFIQNKPTIPTATSDLNNDSGFITSSDIPAQVQSDWNEADSSDPAYIQNKPTIPAAPVQSNWNEADSSSLAYIQNKPSLATVATSGSYTDLSNTPTIPTATSDLNNDSGFITSSDIPAQVQSDWNEADSSDPAYIQNKPTIPAAQVNSDWNAVSGVSQILNKPSLATVATSGSYTDLTNTPTIPTATSDLNNDSGFITSSDIPAQVQSDWNEADTTDPAYIQNKPTIPAAPVQSNWNEADTNSLAYIQNKPTIPTATSDLNNDSGFITSSDIPAQVQSDWNESDSNDAAYIKNKPTIPAAPVQSNWNESDNSSLAYIQNKPTIPAAPVQSNWNEANNSSLAYIQNKPPMTTETWTFTLSNKTTITRTVYIVPSYRVHVTNSYSPSVELEYSYDDDTYTTTTDFDEYLDAGTSVWFRVTSSGSMPGEYVFTGWSDGWSDPLGGDGTRRQITVTGNVTLSVEAEEIPMMETPEVSVKVYENGMPAEDGCTVNVNGSSYDEFNSHFSDGDTVTIIEEPAEGYEFDHWVFQGDFDPNDMPDTDTDTITFTVYNGMHYNVDALFSSVEE